MYGRPLAVLIPEVHRMSETASSPPSARSRVCHFHPTSEGACGPPLGGQRRAFMHHTRRTPPLVDYEQRAAEGQIACRRVLPIALLSGQPGGAVVWKCCSLVRPQGRRVQALRSHILVVTATDSAWEVDGQESGLLRRLCAQTLASVPSPPPQALLTAEGRRSLQH